MSSTNLIQFIFKIHVISTSCCDLYGYWCGAYCNDRIYVQSIDDLIYHDIRYPSSLYYRDLSSGGPLVRLMFDSKTGSATIPKVTALRVTFIGGVFSVSSSKFRN